MFQAVYDSGWHHPGAAFAAGILVLGALLLRRPHLYLLGLILELQILCDALFTGAWSPLPPKSAAAELLALLFVVLGDGRFFYLLFRQGLPRRLAAGVALLTALAVPVVAFSAVRGLPSLLPTTRHLFLVYELAFALLAVVLFTRIRREDPVGRWMRLLCLFEAVQYALWATADLIILKAGDVGFLVRIVPNVLYYAAFVPFAVFLAPKDART